MSSAHAATAKATGMIVFSSCCFGSLTTLTFFVTRAGLPLLPAMVWRYSLAAAALILIARRPILGSGVTRRQALRLMLVGGCGQALITYLSLRALDYLPVGPLGFLFYTYPAWVVLIAAVTGKEELTFLRLVALSIAMAGITVMVGTPFSGPLNATGVMIALGTAVLYAIYLPALHSVQRGISSLPATFYLICGVCLSFLIAGILTGALEMPETQRQWGFVILLSLVGTVLAFVALLAGLRVLGPVRTSIISTIEPFFTAILGVVLLGEVFSFTMLSGGALIAAAVLLLQWASRAKGEVEAAA